MHDEDMASKSACILFFHEFFVVMVVWFGVWTNTVLVLVDDGRSIGNKFYLLLASCVLTTVTSGLILTRIVCFLSQSLFSLQAAPEVISDDGTDEG